LSSASRDRDRDRLERGLQTEGYQELLADLKIEHPFFRRFHGWSDAIAFMRKGTSNDPRKDDVLRPILAANAVGQDPRWRAILLVVFWPALLSLHFRKRHWDKDPDELWHNIAWTFLEVVCRIDVQRRPERLVQKVVNDTAHHLHDEYCRIWDRAGREESAGTEALASIAASPEDDPYHMYLLLEAQELEIRRLRGHLDAGRITEADYLLLVGTRVYGKPVADYAREMGFPYQAVKKRRQRAEAAIRRFHEEISKS
jgi:hypothetical protein